MSGELHRAGSSSAAAVVAAVNGDEEAVSATSTKHHGTAGLTDEDVARLRAEHGYNEVIVASESVWYSVRQPAPTRPRFHNRPYLPLSCPAHTRWSPSPRWSCDSYQIAKRYLDFIPILMIVTAIVSAAVPDSTGHRSWFTFALLIFEVNLVVFVDWYSERNAGNAVSELKRMSAPECTGPSSRPPLPRPCPRPTHTCLTGWNVRAHRCSRLLAARQYSAPQRQVGVAADARAGADRCDPAHDRHRHPGRR